MVKRILIHKTVGEHHDGLDELCHTVQTVAFKVVDGIQNRNSRFKQTHPLRVQLVFDHRQHSERVILRLCDLAVVDFKVLVWRIHANQVVQVILIIAWDVQHVGYGLMPDARVVNHIRHIRVGNVHQQGRFVRVVAVVPFVWKNNAVSLPALQHPLPESPIKRILALILQDVGQLGDFLAVTCCRFRPHIRAGSAAHVAGVEAHALVGVVLYNAIGDFSMVLFCAVEDRLAAQVVVMQKANLVLVQKMNRLCLAHDHFQHIRPIDFGLRRFNRSASGRRFIQKAADDYLILSHAFLLSGKIKSAARQTC